MPMSFWDHLDELRSRLLKIVLAVGVTTTLSFLLADRFLVWLLLPSPLAGKGLTSLQPTSVFIQSLRLSLIAGIILALPILLYQVWSFVKPGLSPKESKAFLWSLYAGTFLFAGGVLFAYFFVIPPALNFFWRYSEKLGVIPAWTVEHYIGFVLMFLLAFGLAFELPVVLVLLVKMGIVSSQFLEKSRPYIIVLLAVLAALLTPPDVVSQILLLIPLWLLFEIALFLSKRI